MDIAPLVTVQTPEILILAAAFANKKPKQNAREGRGRHGDEETEVGQKKPSLAIAGFFLFFTHFPFLPLKMGKVLTPSPETSAAQALANRLAARYPVPIFRVFPLSI